MVFALLRLDVITFSSFSFSVVFGYKFINIPLKKIFPVNIKKYTVTFSLQSLEVRIKTLWLQTDGAGLGWGAAAKLSR